MAEKTYFKPAKHTGWMEMIGPEKWVLAFAAGFSMENLAVDSIWMRAVSQTDALKKLEKIGYTSYFLILKTARSPQEEEILRRLLQAARHHKIRFFPLSEEELPDHKKLRYLMQKCTHALID
ncbi:hypothetical protein [Tunicatimonas pelagia]|uniref:hypothetical protein n=1 Tax=Tunicatimonas pelagia TaxID=931531 RepID=UPI0026671BE3|nr:hypothetical protein [Tunicatimonas pelagia]WKN42209.1 hypothetical protein P0M28_24535 [Tunicatimonas pelagia]WKN45327.1 hypothetical protein P0M28_10185 [Tunicatimonas pelagia]